MASFLKKVQKGAQQVHKSAKSGQLATNIKQSFNQAKSEAAAQIQDLVKVDYDRYLEKPVLLEGKIWKRRGGMGGKFQNLKTAQGESVWELRRFELRGSTLLYYRLPPSDEEEIKFGESMSNMSDSGTDLDAQRHGAATGGSTTSGTPSLAESTWADNKSGSMRMTGAEGVPGKDASLVEDINTPRGHLDFKEDRGLLVHVCRDGHAAGAPSPFCLSIVTLTQVTLTNHQQKTKFMLSFDDQSNMMTWLTALSNVVVQCSVDSYNRQLVEAANPNNRPIGKNEPLPFLLRRPPVKEPPKQQQQTPLEQSLDNSGGGTAEGEEEPTTTHEKVTVTTSHQLWIAHNNFYILKKDSTTEEEEQDAHGNFINQGSTTTTTTTTTQVLHKESPIAALQEMEKQHQNELQTAKEQHAKEIAVLQQQLAAADKKNNNSSSNEEEAEGEDSDVSKATSSEVAADAQKQQQQQQETMIIANLEQKIKDLEASEAAKIEEVTKAAAIAQKMRQQQQDKEIATLKNQIENLQLECKEREQKATSAAQITIQKAEEKAAAGMASVKAAVASTKAQHEKEIADLKQNAKSQQQEFQTQIASLQQQLVQTESTLNQTKSQMEQQQLAHQLATQTTTKEEEEVLERIKLKIESTKEQHALEMQQIKDSHLQYQQEMETKIEQLTAKVAEAEEAAAAAAAAATTTAAQEEQQQQQQQKQHERELQEIKDSHLKYKQEMEAKIEELTKEAASTQEQHQNEISDLQQTIQLLQSSPPEEEEEDDEFHDAM